MKFKKTIVPVIIYTVELRLLCCEIVYLGNKVELTLVHTILIFTYCYSPSKKKTTFSN